MSILASDDNAVSELIGYVYTASISVLILSSMMLTSSTMINGNVTNTAQEDAEQIARKCVNEIRGGTVIPKVLKLQGCYKVIDAMHEAFDRFCDIADQMIEADEIISRTKKR